MSRVVAILSPLFISACEKETVTGLASNPKVASAAPAAASMRSRTLDEDLAELGKEIPGFGGLSYDHGNVLMISLQDTAIGPIARQVVGQFLAARSRAHRGPVQLKQVRFDFGSLFEKYGMLTRSLSRAGFTQTDIDEVRNQIVIGVRDAGVRQRVLSDLVALDLPPNMVSVEIIAPTEARSTLRDRVRPAIGGLRITNRNGRECTLGYNVRSYNIFTGAYGTRRFFVTNSHCTDGIGVDGFAIVGDVFGQPDIANRIGVEIVDPPMFRTAENSECPVGRQCRYSDAALVEYDAGVIDNFGAIARIGTSIFNRGSIVGQYTFVSENQLLFPGTVLYKVGATTNTTSGAITATSCVTVTQYSNGTDTERDYLCQYQADFLLREGDSGAAVFNRVEPSYYPGVSNPVSLVGILWGDGYSVYGDTTSSVRATLSLYHLVSGELGSALGGAGVELRACGC